MAVSNKSTFNLNIAEIIEDAYELCGLTSRSGYDLKTAATSLNMLMLEWASRGVNLFTVDMETFTVASAAQTIVLDPEIVDIIDASIRDSDGTDVSLSRNSLSEYLSYPTKSTTGRPVSYAVELNSLEGNKVYLYPAADAAYTLVAWVIKHVQDAGSYTNNMNIPRKFLPPLVWGLAKYIAFKNPAKYVTGNDGRPMAIDGVAREERERISNEYEIQMARVTAEDRERASFRTRLRLR